MKIITEGNTVLIGGFEFRLTPSAGKGKTTHYLHVYKNGTMITPPKAGAFVNLDEGIWDPMVICDKSCLVELSFIVNMYFSSIRTIRYYKGEPENVRTMKDLNSKTTDIVWRRNG